MHKNLPCSLVLKLYLDNRSSYLTVATHVFHYCHRKTFSKPVLVRFYFHDVTWTEAFHGPHKVSKLHDRRVHTARSVLTMNVQKWIVWKSGSLSLNSFFYECLAATWLASCHQWFILLIGSPWRSFVSSSGWVSSF